MANNYMKTKVTDGRSAFNKNLRAEQREVIPFAQLEVANTHGGEQKRDPRLPFTPKSLPKPLYDEKHRFDLADGRHAIVMWRKWTGTEWVYTVARSWGTNRTYKEQELPNKLHQEDYVRMLPLGANIVTVQSTAVPNYTAAPEGAKVARVSAIAPGDTILQWATNGERWLGGVIALTAADEYGRVLAMREGHDTKAEWFVLEVQPRHMLRIEGCIETRPSAWEKLALYPSPDELFAERVRVQLESNAFMRRLDNVFDATHGAGDQPSSIDSTVGVS